MGGDVIVAYVMVCDGMTSIGDEYFSPYVGGMKSVVEITKKEKKKEKERKRGDMCRLLEIYKNYMYFYFLTIKRTLTYTLTYTLTKMHYSSLSQP